MEESKIKFCCEDFKVAYATELIDLTENGCKIYQAISIETNSEEEEEEVMLDFVEWLFSYCPFCGEKLPESYTKD